MWRFWQRKPFESNQYRTVDFSQPSPSKWAKFEGGDNFDACFRINGDVRKGDEILVPMASGRIGRYCLFSVLPDFRSGATWMVRSCAIGYEDRQTLVIRHDSVPTPTIKGLLGDGTGRSRPDFSQSLVISSGFTQPTSEFWKILVRDEARRSRSNSMRTANHL